MCDSQPSEFFSVCGKDPNCCTVWKDGVCNKGRIKDKKCVSSMTIWPTVLMSIGVLSFVGAIVAIIMMAISKNKKISA